MLAVAPTVVAAQTAPYGEPGQAPRFQLGLADPKARLGATMGEPVECEGGEGD